MAHQITTEADARATQAAQDKLLGYPARGTHVGAGVHVPMPDTWDGTGDCPPGWTATHARVEKHPARDEWAVELHPDLPGEVTRNGGRLTAGERGQLLAASMVARDLPADWRPDPGLPGVGTTREDEAKP